MQLTPVNCNHCGASLEIPSAARFVTCRYCNSQLQVHRSETTITTEVLQRIDQNTASMAEDLQAIR
jgi:DNA-directed RNA polymerase subunit RPC12/RpoP